MVATSMLCSDKELHDNIQKYRNTKDEKYFNFIYKNIKHFIIYCFSGKLNYDIDLVEDFFAENSYELIKSSLEKFNPNRNKGCTKYRYYVYNVYRLRFFTFITKLKQHREIEYSMHDSISKVNTYGRSFLFVENIATDVNLERDVIIEDENYHYNQLILKTFNLFDEHKIFTYFIEIYAKYLLKFKHLNIDELKILIKETTGFKRPGSYTYFFRTRNIIKSNIEKNKAVIDIDVIYKGDNSIWHIIEVDIIRDPLTEEIKSILENKEETNYYKLKEKTKKLFNIFINKLKTKNRYGKKK